MYPTKTVFFAEMTSYLCIKYSTIIKLIILMSIYFFIDFLPPDYNIS